MKKLLLFIGLLFSTSIFSQTVSTFYQNADIDDGLAFDSQGNLYGARYTGSKVWKITPDGVRTEFVTNLNTPNGLAVDSQDFLYVVDNQGGAIYKVAPDGTKSTLVPNIYSPSGITKMPDSDTMIVTSWEGDKLYKVAPDGMVTDFVVGNGLEGPVGAVYGNDNDLFVGNYNNRWIFKISPSGIVDTLTRLNVAGSNIGFITFRNDFIYATMIWDNKIYKIDMDGNYQLFAGAGPGNTNGDIDQAKFNGPNGILLHPNGDSLYISDFNTSSVRIISNLDGLPSSTDFIRASSIQKSALIPNLVKQQTTFSFDLKQSHNSSMQIYDIQGQLVKTIFENRILYPGENRIEIDASELIPATYFVRLITKAGDEVVKKMVKMN